MDNIFNILDDLFSDESWEQMEKEEALKMLGKWYKDNYSWVQDTIQKIISKNNSLDRDEYFKDDLSQDIYLILHKTNPTKLIKLITTGDINYFIVRLIQNNINSNTSPYYKQYIDKSSTTINNKDLQKLYNIVDELPIEDQDMELYNHIFDFYNESLGQADKLIFHRYYFEKLTLKQISKIYKVSLSFIWLSINRIKKVLLYQLALMKMNKKELEVEIEKTIKLFNQSKKPEILFYNKAMILYNFITGENLVNTQSKGNYQIIKQFFNNLENDGNNN